MTPFVLHHYDTFRSPLLVTCSLKIVILNGGKNALWERREAERWHRVKNLLPWMTSYGFSHHGNRSFAIAQDDVLPLSSPRQQILHIRFGWRLNVLYKDHGAGRQKELLAHVVRLMIPACRNDLIVKEYLACSRQLTADSFYLLTVFLTTAANPLLTLRMTSCHPPSFSTFSCQLTANGSQLSAIIPFPKD